MAFVLQADPETLQSAWRLAWAVELVSVDTQRLHAERLAPPGVSEGPVEGPLTLSGTQTATAHLAEDRSHLVVEVRFRAEGRQGGEENAPLVRVELALSLTYAIPGARRRKFAQRTLTSFAELNGIYNAWPYWRAFLQDAMTRLGFPGVVAPVLRIYPTDGSSGGWSRSASTSKSDGDDNSKTTAGDKRTRRRPQRDGT